MNGGTAHFPTFSRRAETPPLKAGPEGGIAIACPRIVHLGSSTVMPLYGVFLLPKREAGRFGPHLLNGVVILLRGPDPATRSAGDGRFLFEDDLVDEGERVRGHFNLDLFAHFGLPREPARYWVSASILRHVSEVVTVEALSGRNPAGG